MLSGGSQAIKTIVVKPAQANPNQADDALQIAEQKPDEPEDWIDVQSEVNADNIPPVVAQKPEDDWSDISHKEACQYLQVFDDEELAELKKLYSDKSLLELDNHVASYPQLLWWYRIDFCLANATNLLFVVFQINTSNEGIVQFIQTLSPGAVVPSNVAYGIGASTAILDTGMYMVVFSAYKEAIKATLEYALNPSIQKRLQKEIEFVRKSPGQACIELVKTLFHQFILYTTDLTGVMTEVIGIASKILALPTPLNWLVVAGILRYGKRYFGPYMDEEYFKGLDFWQPNPEQPWLYQKILQGDIAIPAQIIIQNISAVGLRVYPYYYFLALASATALGGWLPASVVAGVVAVHSFAAICPKTYKHYLEDQLKVESLLPDKKEMESYCVAIIKEQGRLFLFRQEPMMLIPVVYRSVVSGYMGYQLGLLCSVGSIALPIAIAFVSASVLGGGLYKAEANRVMYKLIRGMIDTVEVEKNKAEGVRQQTTAEMLVGFLGKLLNVDAAFSSAMSTIGTGSQLPSNTPAATSLIAILALERALNVIKFNEKRVDKTVKSLFLSKEGGFSFCNGGFFHRKKAAMKDRQSVEIEMSVIAVSKP